MNPGGSSSRRRPSRNSTKRNPSTFKPRTPDQISQLVANWEQYVHPRGRDFFQTDERLRDTLAFIVRNINANEDPILGNSDCVFWYGPTSKDTPEQAIMELPKPGEVSPSRSPTFVNRLLSFVFATDESFARLMKLPKEPFRMSCGDQLCINIKHISD